MASIELNDICKQYSEVEVLKNINICVNDKEFLVLVGPSGCGKSTLLRMIAGLETTTGGHILVDGKDVTHEGPQDRDLAMVFQSYALYPHMTTRQNIGFPLKLRKTPKDEMNEKVEAAAKTLELTDYLDRLPKNLSGGQRQRVAMGRAIVRAPRAFLFDEPLSNLDAKLRTHMRTEIRTLHQDLNATSIYVTHDQVEAMTMADRIVVMNGGGIEQIGTPLELFDEPKSVFVAGFLGAPSMNFFEAIVSENANPNLNSDTEVGTLCVPRSISPSSKLGDKLKIGIRPQHLALSQPKNDDLWLEGTCIVTEQTGCETNIVANVASQNDWTIQTPDRVMISSGERFSFVLPNKHLHIFDESGQNRLN